MCNLPPETSVYETSIQARVDNWRVTRSLRIDYRALQETI